MTDKKKDRPFVFVRCMTFNHEAYIKDALNGFVMQQTNFPFVVAIVDDASTDDNVKVIERFIKEHCECEADYIKEEIYGRVIKTTVKNNPNCILCAVLLYENHYRKKAKRPYYAQYEDAAKYIAMCEGDDYWTDPLKLQKQVDFMEANPECGLCYTDYSKCNSGGELIEDSHYMKSGDQPILTFEDHLFRQGYIAPMTWLYRKDVYESITDNMLKGTSDGSYVVALEFFYNSKVAFLPINTATYRVSPGSASKPNSLAGMFKYRKSVYDTGVEYAKRYTNNQWYISFIRHQEIHELYPIAVKLNDTDYIKWCHRLDKEDPLIQLFIPQCIINLQSSRAYRLGMFILKPFSWLKRKIK